MEDRPDVGSLCWMRIERKSIIVPRVPVLIVCRAIEMIRFVVYRIDTQDTRYEGIWPWELKVMAPLEQLAWAEAVETLRFI